MTVKHIMKKEENDVDSIPGSIQLIHSKPVIMSALEFAFASNLSDFRLELTFELDFKSRFLANEISSVHQVY